MGITNTVFDEKDSPSTTWNLGLGHRINSFLEST